MNVSYPATQEKCRKAARAMEFLQYHPAFVNPMATFFVDSGVTIVPSCKRGLAECYKHACVMERGDKGWKKFENRFKKEDKEYEEEVSDIYVTYKEKYGEPWVFDHVSYVCEVDFFAFTGDPYMTKDVNDCKKYDRHHGWYETANTFEDMLINCAKATRKLYGNFSVSRPDFLTEEEIDNHKHEDYFTFDLFRSGKNKEINFAEVNPNYMDVSDGLMNLRWLKWFSLTEYCKEEFEGTFDSLVNDIDITSIKKLC